MPKLIWLRLVARVLDHPCKQWLGAISSPLYLVQEPTQRALGWLVAMAVTGDRMAFSLIWGPLALIVPIGLAALLHYGVEREFTRVRRFLQPGEAARPKSPAL